MNNNMFSFIIYSQNNQVYKECIYHINELKIPKDYKIEIIKVNEGKSIACAYNKGMKESNGKYKIYMDEDVFILNKNILIDSLNIFSKDEKIGMIGIVGSKNIQPSGVWWESGSRLGKVIESSTGIVKPLDFDEVKNDYEEVGLIDEMLTITKVDIPFRDDLLDGNFFHTSMQCIDTLINGYKIVVPKQEDYWVMHDCGVVNLQGYEKSKKVFETNYSQKAIELSKSYEDITLSLCMIVKNEENSLARCLNSIKDALDEIIIVDTGSTDKTIEIAKEFGAKVYNYEWIDNFGDARNYAFSKATKDYIIWLDADDIVTEENAKKIKDIKTNFDKDIDSVNMKYVLSEDANGNDGYVLRRNRIVKRSNGFKWIGHIHEYLEVAGNILHADIGIHHRKDKEYTDRNLRIYRQMLKDGVELSVRDMLYYSNELYYNYLYTEAIEAYNKFLDTNLGWVEDVKTALFNLSKCYEIKGNGEKRLETLLLSLKHDVPRADFCCEIAVYFFNKQEYDKAIFWYKQALNCNNEGSVSILDHGTYTWIPAIQLCVCYSHIGEYKIANDYNEEAAKYIPDDERVAQNRNFLKDKI